MYPGSEPTMYKINVTEYRVNVTELYQIDDNNTFYELKKKYSFTVEKEV